MKKTLISMLVALFALQAQGQVFLNEGFETAPFPPTFPAQWIRVTTMGQTTKTWERISSFACTGNHCARADYSEDANSIQEDWLITPLLRVAANDTLKFWARCLDTDDNTWLRIKVSTTDTALTSFTFQEMELNNATSTTVSPRLTNAYQEFKVPLDDYIGQDVYIAFVHYDTYGYSLYLDDITGPEVVLSCPDVFNFNVGIGISGSVNISWDTTVQDAILSGWNIAWDVTSGDTFDPAIATNIQWVSESDFPYNISGLTEGVSYTFAMQNACGSAWTTPITITFPTVKTVPYNQDFEDLNDVAEWQFDNFTVNEWVIGSATGNIGKSMYVSNDSGSSNAYTNTITYAVASAIIDFGNFEEYYLSFDWKANGEATYDFLRVYIAPADYPIPVNGFPTGVGVTQLGGNMNLKNSWQRANFFFSDTCSGTIQKLVFLWFNNGSGAYNPPAAIDNISLIGSNCKSPYDITVNNITQTTATVTWNAPAVEPANGYEYYVSTSDITPLFSEIATGATTTTSIDLDNLSSATTYYVWIRSVCSSTETSGWSISSAVFNTLCNGAIDIPYTQNFETYTGTTYDVAGEVPVCWDNYSINTDYPAPHITGGGDFHHYPYSGSKCLTFLAGTYGNGTDAYAMLPVFNQPISDLIISFMYRQEDVAWGTLTVGYIIGSQNDISTFSPVIVVPPTETHQEFICDFSAHDIPSNATCIALHWYCNHSYYSCSVDDIAVEAVVCFPPTNVAVSNPTTTTADISWQQGDNETAWIIEYAPTGGNYTSVNVSSSPYTITGLQSNTTYSVHIKSACDSTTNSSPSASQTFTTQSEPCDNPTNIATVETDHTITVSWQPMNGETQWKILYSTTDFSGEASVTNPPPYTLTNLLSNTTYKICVIAICAQGIESADNNCINATTLNDDVGISDIALANSVKLYPNPASDRLTVEMDSKFNTIEITNTLGQTFYRALVIDNQAHIDISDYSAGMYYVTLHGNNGMVIRKFVKK